MRVSKLSWVTEDANNLDKYGGAWFKDFISLIAEIRWRRRETQKAEKREREKESYKDIHHSNAKCEKITLLSSRFCSASFPVLSLISTFLGWEMSVCRSMTRPSLLPLHAESASKSSVLLSEEPSTGQNMPQNFCLGLEGLSEPMFLKKAGTSPAVDMPESGGGTVGFLGVQLLRFPLRSTQPPPLLLQAQVVE